MNLFLERYGYVMIKKLLLGTLIVAISMLTVGCNNKDLDAVKTAQNNLVNLNSGHIIVSAGVKTDKKTDATTTDFTYMKNNAGVFEYCQSQQDGNNKLVYCEVSDGEKAEQWLLGKGWSVIEPKAYTAENSHRFIALIANEIDKDCIAKMEKVAEDSNTHYNLELDSKKLNKTVYKDTSIEVISQSISYVIDKDGQLISYTDVATIFDKEANCNAEYTLEAHISEQNTLTEIVKPEVKSTQAEADAENANADIELQGGK